jgi:DNA-binding CsgD family transcriptional regulator
LRILQEQPKQLTKMTQLRPVEITIYLLRTIFKECTGSRQEIANHFNISPKMVSEYIKKLEVETNTTIAFNRIRNSYYYESGKPPFTPPLI